MIDLSEIKHHPIEEVRKRLERHMNWICFTHGTPGSGKSESNLGIAYLLDPDFNISGICFDVADYVKAMRDPNIKVVMFDDCGYGLSSRRHQSQENQTSSVIAQTTRVLGKASLYNSPDIKFADVSIRRLIHTLLEPMKIDIEKHLNIVKWLNVTYNPRIDKIYYKYPRIVYNNQVVRATRISIPRAPIKIVHEYESLKTEFIQRILNEADERLSDKSNKKESAISPQMIVQRIRDNPDIIKRISLEKKGVMMPDKDLLAMEFGVGRARAERAIKLLALSEYVAKKTEKTHNTPIVPYEDV